MYDDEFARPSRLRSPCRVALSDAQAGQGKANSVMRHREADDSFPFRQQASEIARGERPAPIPWRYPLRRIQKLGATFRLVSAVD